MNRIFSDHVRSLADGTGDVDVHLFDAAWKKLGDALRSEMRKRGIWRASPSYLGLVGYSSWSQVDAFFELQNDCYEFSFVLRLPGLSALLASLDNIEGLVFRNIQNFLSDLQKKFDPLGYRVFEMSRSAVRQLEEDGRLICINGSWTIWNHVVLAFPPHSEIEPVPREVLAEVVESWGSILLPDLVLCRGKRLESVVETLCRLILGLEDEGIYCFRFKDLVHCLKGSVRRAWAATWKTSEGEWSFEDGDEDGSVLVQWVPPDGDFETRRRFQDLKRCVERGIDGLDAPPALRLDLEKLWRLLCLFAEGALEADGPSSMPSNRGLAKYLRITRDRLKKLIEILGTLLQDCLGTEH